MSKIEELEPGSGFVYGDNFVSGDYNQALFLRHSKIDASQKPKYFITVCSRINGKIVQQGYIYFYLDYQTRTSDFISVIVKPEYRNLNIGSFLVASWIDLCMNNGYNILGSNQEQRKPFLLYMLKKYGFEILDISLYDTRPDIVSIYRSSDELNNGKFLLFKSPEHERLFRHSSINSSDNYCIISGLEGDIIYLDKVLLPLHGRSPLKGTYRLSKENISVAEQLSQQTISKHRR